MNVRIHAMMNLLSVVALVGAGISLSLVPAPAEAKKEVHGASLRQYADVSTFPDIQTHWAKDTITTWLEAGKTTGYPDGTFRPQQQILRAEWMTLTNRIMGFTEGNDAVFADVDPKAWYADVVQKATKAGYISGNANGTIAPKAPITRQEVALILARIAKLPLASADLDPVFTDRTAFAPWSTQAIYAVTAANYMTGYPDGTFRPKQPITRAEAIVTLARLRAEACVTPPCDTEKSPPLPTDPLPPPISPSPSPISPSPPPITTSTSIITEVKALPPLTVSHGTTFAQLNAPSTVQATVSNGNSVSVISLPVKWNTNEYNGNRTQTQTITATFANLPAHISNPNAINATLTIDVQGSRTLLVRTSFFENTAIRKVPVTLLEQNAVGEIWMEDKYVDKSTAQKTLAQQLVKEFSDTVIPLVTTNFYSSSDIDGNGKIAIFIGDIATIPLEYAGYFSSEDLIPTLPNSNKMEILYINHQYTKKLFEQGLLWHVHALLAHELQHLVNANPSLGAKSMDTWLNEALSLASEHLYVTSKNNALGLSAFIQHYNKESATRGNQSVTQWGDNNYSYALSYLFGQYIRTQIEQKQGKQLGMTYFREIVTSRRNASAEFAVETVIRKYIDPSLTFAQFLAQFRLALQKKEASGPYGFHGEPFFNGIN